MEKRHHLAGVELGTKSKGIETLSQRKRRARHFNFETVLRNAKRRRLGDLTAATANSLCAIAHILLNALTDVSGAWRQTGEVAATRPNR
jgi:hypothetical protein